MVTKRQPSEQELRDALFCWKVAKFVKSNAIVYAKNNMTIGIGAGQMSRVYSAKSPVLQRLMKARKCCSSMASDAFFLFRDGMLLPCGRDLRNPAPAVLSVMTK